MLKEFFNARRSAMGAIVSLLIVAMGLSLLAQTAGTGALTGTVKDPSGAVVPGATVTITSADTGQARTTMSGADGVYKFSLLLPGNYRVRIEAGGFRPVDIPSATITVTETAVLDRALEVGAQTQSVTVEGEVEAIQTASSALGTVVNTQTVVALPLSTRNFTNLLAMSAGASADLTNSATLGKSSTDISVNGGGINQNTILQDGTAVNNWWSANTDHEGTLYGGFGIPNPDTIQEFKIQTSTYDAGYGRNPGANVNVITKSGTNDFHGTAFEFFRNTALNANDWFRNATGGSKLVLNQNQYGGVFGGPIKKDKLFFFVSYQETNQKNGISGFGYSSVILPPIPGGSRGSCPVGWTALSQCDAAAQAFVPALGAAVCPGNNPTNAFDKIKTKGSITVKCDGSNINPVAINILQLQLPNGGGYLVPGSGSTTGQYLPATYTDPATFKDHQGMGNWDYVLSSKHTLSGRYSFEADPILGTFASNGTSITASTNLLGSGVTAQKENQTALLKLTSVLSNSVVNEARVSYQRVVTTANELTPFTDSQVGVTPISPAIDYLSYFGISGLFNLGAMQNFYIRSYANQFQWADQVSWTRGKHTFRTGFEVQRMQASESIPGHGIGTPKFKSFPDFLIGRAACAPGTFPSTCNTTTPGSSNGSSQSNLANSGGDGNPAFDLQVRLTALNGFIQDDFKVNSRLTLNLGVRWEFDGFPIEKDGITSNIWPSLVGLAAVPGSGCVTSTGPIGLGVAGTGCSLVGFEVPSNFQGPIPGGVYQNTYPYLTSSGPPRDNFAPRIGFAWQPTASNRLVVRGGAGYFYDLINGITAAYGTMSGIPGIAPIAQSNAASLASPFVLPAAVPGPPGSFGFTPRWIDLTTGSNSNLAPKAATTDLTTPLTYEWNLNVQYEFLRNWVLELGYVGSHGVHQYNSGEGGDSVPWNWAMLASPTNPINGQMTNTVTNVPDRVPNLGISPAVALLTTDLSYKYNALQTTVRKQMSHGLQLQAAYTWNRAFISTPNGINTAPYLVDVMAPNTTYHPQRLVVSYTWQLPLGHAAGLEGKLLDGWSLSGVTTIQDGPPISIYDSTGGSVFFGAGAPASPPGGIINPPAQLCPGMTHANAVTSGPITSRLGGSFSQNGYLNPAAFCSTPVLGSDGQATGYGNIGPADLLAPGQSNWDISLAKATKVGGFREDATLLFRAEFFNAFNHPQFSFTVNNDAAAGNQDVSAATFGQITTSSVNPRLIQLVLKYSF
jgi:Carboxypeptidase regulatory-like domain